MLPILFLGRGPDFFQRPYIRIALRSRRIVSARLNTVFRHYKLYPRAFILTILFMWTSAEQQSRFENEPLSARSSNMHFTCLEFCETCHHSDQSRAQLVGYPKNQQHIRVSSHRSEAQHIVFGELFLVMLGFLYGQNISLTFSRLPNPNAIADAKAKTKGSEP